MEIKVRIGNAGDAASLAALNQEVHSIHVKNVPWVFRSPASTEMEATFRMFLSDESHRTFIAYRGEETVGYLLLMRKNIPQNPFCRERNMIEMDQICVKESYRRKGIARHLLEEAKSYCRESGFDEIHLSVWGFNTVAQQSFASLGFKEYYKKMALKI